MLPELGHFLLIIATLAAMAGFVLPFIGLLKNNASSQNIAHPASYLQFICIGASFLILMYAFAVSDFSVVTVADNSHSLKPIFYKIAAAWGNHEGSLLLWLSVLTCFGAALAFTYRNSAAPLITATLAVQSFITFGFAVFTLFTSNPFLRISPPPAEGLGLNPVLQDPALIFHPPMLYLGYVGFALTFSFAAAALITRPPAREWAAAVRPWAMAAWVFLTIGIALGAWWAYYELGWGGWWFWDPVENASLMPWLAGTALIHSLAVSSKRGALGGWSILLALMCFALSVLGTFMVRSGILTSVHAFALDPERGSYILMFCLLLVGSAFALYALRTNHFKSGILFHWSSREAALLFNNILFIVILLLVLTGTFWPLIVDTLQNKKITIGPSFYLKTVIPLFVPLLLLLPLAPLLQWSLADIRTTAQRLSVALLVAIAAATITYSAIAPRLWLAVAGIALACWTIFGATAGLRTKTTARQIGMAVSHIGLGIMILGITGTQILVKQYDISLGYHEAAKIGDYHLQLTDITSGKGENYFYDEAHVDILAGDKKIGELHPGKRYYPTGNALTSEVAIASVGLGDIYLVMGDYSSADKRWGFRAYQHPLVIFLWLGMAMIAAGGAIAMIGKRKHD